MQMIEIIALDNGAHNNQTFHGALPEGWAIIPNNMETPNFPFGEVTAEKIDGVMTVTSWKAIEIPDEDNGIEEPTQLDRIEAQIAYTAMMTDTLLEV